MSDTPRTDALLAKWHGEWGADALLTLTRQLERELNAARPEERASYDPVSGKCRGDCDCSIGQTCKAYLVYKQRTMNSGERNG